jgi:proteasome lid subunit RPN8/RPN11
LEIFREVKERGWELSGIFHSHLDTPAYPSQQDIDMACYPDVVHLIASPCEGSSPMVGGFSVRDAEVVEEEIQMGSEGEGENLTLGH